MEHVDILILGCGTAATNAARTAVKNGAERVVLIRKPELINTCVEEGCMPSKSILAGAHAGESLAAVEATRNAHIERLRTALTNDFADSHFEIVEGTASFQSDHEVQVACGGEETLTYHAERIIIATGSHSFVPPIPGADPAHERILISDEVVSERAHFPAVPRSVLVVGAGPIGLELATFFHDMGSEVEVLQRGPLLRMYDPEFGEERYRASQDPANFPIHLHSTLEHAVAHDTGVTCQIKLGEEHLERTYDYVLVATGRRPNLDELALENTSIERDERGGIVHDEQMQTSVPHIFTAGDVTGHHQILHFAAEMGKVAGENAANPDANATMDYDKHLLAVSFDQFPSALIGLTEQEAVSRGIDVVTATRHFNSIGLGILKRHEYGLWKIVVERSTGRIIGSQVLGPTVAGELVQLLVPILANGNTVADVVNMTWYHPTYAEILHSLARDVCRQDTVSCPGT